MLRSKYKCGWRGLPKIDDKKIGSNFWRGLGQSWETFVTNLSWKVGNGEGIIFWLDVWVPDCDPINTYSTQTIAQDELQVPISQYVTYNGEWRNVNLFQHLLPIEIVQSITRILPPFVLKQEGEFCWGATLDGSFSTKSAYNILNSNNYS